MTFYVATALAHRDEAKRIMSVIEARGHTISLDWTRDSVLERPYTKDESAARYRAERDVKAVIHSDVFILLSSSEVTRSAHVELGTALMSSIVGGKPQIFVIGEHKDHGMFFFHPKVQRVKTIDDVFVILNQ